MRLHHWSLLPKTQDEFHPNEFLFKVVEDDLVWCNPSKGGTKWLRLKTKILPKIYLTILQEFKFLGAS